MNSFVVFKKLVTDVALGKQSSRTLNTNDDIKKYFKSWDPNDLPSQKRGSFVPADIVQGRSVVSSSAKPAARTATSKGTQISKTVLPRDFKLLYGNDRLRDIRRELGKLNREQFPNAGAVLLRVSLNSRCKTILNV